MKFTIQIAVFFTVIAAAIAASDLRDDLREFLALIPRRRIGFIAARRYLVDAKFHSALDYLRGADFQREWRQISTTPEFVAVLDYVEKHGGPVADDVLGVIDRIPNHLRDLQIPRQVPTDAEDDEVLHLLEERNLSTFLREAMYAMPRSRIQALMARKVREGGDFARLYKAVRATTFRQMVDQARSSSGLAPHIEELQSHHINVDDVIDIAFEVLQWGPK